MSDLAEIELDFYERFFFSKDLEPYPVQERAFGHIFKDESVLVTVPTGTGKTMMAKAAIFKALARGQRAAYTTPLRALTEEKYRELCADFGEDQVGFATGDYKVNPDAPVQVLVAEILWNKIFGDRVHVPADVVVMDEAHYFNEPERGYVWEQSLIALDPRVQLIMLSATVGRADQFCYWAELVRKIPLHLVESRERRVPLVHEFREQYLIECVRDLAAKGDVPAIVFVFGRERCFEVARLLKSCRRFTSDDERAEVERRCDGVLLGAGVSDELRALLFHGIGVHHAGILPRYKQLVEELALDRLIKFVVSTETISAGINLPARTVVFPSLRKYVRKKARLVTAAEFHQMAGRAGRPQFDTEGLAIALAPEEIVQELRKEIKDLEKRGRNVDEEKIRRGLYSRARAEARKRDDVVYDQQEHRALIDGEPAELRSRTRITPEQILAIGLPDLTTTCLPGADGGDQGAVSTAPIESLPVYMNLNIVTVIDNLLLSDRERNEAHKLLAHLTDNLRAMGVVDEHGAQVSGEMIGELQGLDGLFILHVLMSHQLDYLDCRELVEFLVDHDVIQKSLDKQQDEKRREWIKNRLRERRVDNPQVSWEDVEAEYEQKFPRELTKVEIWHQEFCARLPHPELHGGKKPKNVWATIEAEEATFLSFIDTHRLSHEEGSLFSYLARVMKTATKIYEATGVGPFEVLAHRVREVLSVIDARLVAKL